MYDKVRHSCRQVTECTKKLRDTSDWIPQKLSPIHLESAHTTTTHTTECISLAASNRTSAWLLYDTWPSWLYALPHYHILFTRIFTTEENLLSHQALHSEFSQADCHPLSALVEVDCFTMPSVLLAQGSQSLWSLPIFSTWQHSTIIFSPDMSFKLASSPPPPCWQQFSLSHSECGGVLEVTWEFFCGHGIVQAPLFTSPICRSLLHVINPSLTASETPSMFRHTPLQSTACLLRLHLAHAVLCPTVFPSRPVLVRSLSLKELSQALDLPASVELPSVNHPSCVAAPAKLLYHAFHSCVCSTKGGGWSGTRLHRPS